MSGRIIAVDPGYTTGGYVVADVGDDGALVPLAWGCWRESKTKAGWAFQAVTHWPSVGAIQLPETTMDGCLIGARERVGGSGTGLEAARVVVEGMTVQHHGGLGRAGGAMGAAQAAGAVIEALGVCRHEPSKGGSVERPTWAQWTAGLVAPTPKRVKGATGPGRKEASKAKAKAMLEAIKAQVPEGLRVQVEAAVGNAQQRQAVYDAWGMAMWAAKGGEK